MSGNTGLTGSDRAKPPPATSLLAMGQALAVRSRRAWQAYWFRLASRAIICVLEAMDDRMLRNSGLSRREIATALRGWPPRQAC